MDHLTRFGSFCVSPKATPNNYRSNSWLTPSIVMARLVRATYSGTLPQQVARTRRAMTILEKAAPPRALTLCQRGSSGPDDWGTSQALSGLV